MYFELKQTNFPLSFFPPQVLRNWYMSIKLADHLYFTRSKGPADSYPGQSSDKGKAVMSENNKEISLTDIWCLNPP